MGRMVTAGKISGLFGAKGEVTLSLYDDFPRERNIEEPVFVKIDSHTVPLFFDRFASRGQRGATALFADIDTESRASELVGLEFFIRPETGTGDGRGEERGRGRGDELCFEDLVGWEADLGGGKKGRVAAFFDSGFNPLFEIETDGGPELVPAQEEFIASVDERRRRVVFALPEGLIGLNG